MTRTNPCLWPLAGLSAAVLVAGGALLAIGQSTAYEAPGTTANRLADGFDFPVGVPDAVGYRKARGFTPNGHLGEDWNGNGGGDTDLGDPIYSVAQGTVVLARDVRLGWGNVVIIRHTFRDPAEGDGIKSVDSLYGHLDAIGVREGQTVTRGQQIGTMGTAHGMYDAHLHFEVRKNLTIGMYRSAFARDFSNYYDPTQFIAERRRLRAGGSMLVAMNTFVPYPGNNGSLPESDGAYELGVNNSPSQLARAESSRLNKSAFSIKRRTPGNNHPDRPGEAYRVDRYEDIRK